MSLMQWPGRRRKAPRSGWLKHVPDDELDVLMALLDLDSLPPEAQRLFAEIRTHAELKVERAKMLPALPSPSQANTSNSFADTLRIRWASADASVRHTLRTVANALGIDVPITRTRPVAAKDSGSTRRTAAELHLTQPEPRSSGTAPDG